MSKIIKNVDLFNANAYAKILKELEVSKFGMDIGLPLCPRVISKNAVDFLECKSQELIAVLLKVKEVLKENPELRKKIGLSPAEEGLFLLDASLYSGLDIVRIDSFFDVDSLKFLEINTNAPDGIGGEDAVAKIFTDTALKGGQMCHYKRQSLDQETAKWLSILLKTAYPAQNDFNVFIAVDGKNELEIRCIKMALNSFKTQGLKCVIGNLDDLVFDKGGVFYNDKVQHMIFRRFDISTILGKYNNYQKLFELIRKKKVLFVNPFSDSILGYKAIFALLTDQKFKEFFNHDLSRHLPWTRIIEDTETTDTKGNKIFLKNYIENNKNKLVFKASVGTEGKQVFIGKEITKGEWLKLIKTILSSSNTWIVQEFIKSTTDDTIIIKNGITSVINVNYDTDPHMINKKFICALSRWGTGSNILNFFKGNAANVFFVNTND